MARRDEAFEEDSQELMDDPELLGEEEEEEEEVASSGLSLAGIPAWGISTGCHVLLLLILSLLAATTLRIQEPEQILASLEDRKAPPVETPNPTDMDTKVQFQSDEAPTEHPVQVMDKNVEISDHMETQDEKVNMQHLAKGEEDAISNIPLGGAGVQDVMGVGGGGGGRFGWRDGGGRRNLVKGGGGSAGSESAVERALRWLARHQEADGHWDCSKYGGGGRKRESVSNGFDEAVTGLSVLAFLGAGYTEDTGKYKDNVRRAVYWLEEHQKPDGSWAGNNYANNICTLASAESFGMSGKHKEMAQKAVNFMKTQQTQKGGWDYRQPGSRSDTSITGWGVMAAKSAKLAGLEVPQDIFEGALKHFTSAGAGSSDKIGRVFYSIGGEGAEGATNPGHGDAQEVISMLALLYLGNKPDNPWMIAAADNTLKKGILLNNFYYLYYGSLAMFQVGAAHWETWNKGMRDQLVQRQIKGGDDDGSWDPAPDRYGQEGGRVYTTSLGAMCLEVYYRYLPIYKQ